MLFCALRMIDVDVQARPCGVQARPQAVCEDSFSIAELKTVAGGPEGKPWNLIFEYSYFISDQI